MTNFPATVRPTRSLPRLSEGGVPSGLAALTGNRLAPSFVLPGGFPGEPETDHFDFLQVGWTHLLPAVSGLEGTSLRPLLDDPRQVVKTAAFSIAPRSPPELGRSVRNERWRYTEWPDGGRELYDLGPPGPWTRLLAAIRREREPVAPRNLASDPRFAGTIAEMQALIDRVGGR